jgi:hypothetical protein
MLESEPSPVAGSALPAELDRPAPSSETARRIEVAREARELGASLRKDPKITQSVYLKRA